MPLIGVNEHPQIGRNFGRRHIDNGEVDLKDRSQAAHLGRQLDWRLADIAGDRTLPRIDHFDRFTGRN